MLNSYQNAYNIVSISILLRFQPYWFMFLLYNIDKWHWVLCNLFYVFHFSIIYELFSFGDIFFKGIYFAENSSKSNQYVYGIGGGTGCPIHKDRSCYVCQRYFKIKLLLHGYILLFFPYYKACTLYRFLSIYNKMKYICNSTMLDQAYHHKI